MYEGEIVRKIRKEKKMTGKEAKLSGYAPSFISELEHNKATPSVTTLESIAKALDVSMGVITGEEFYYPFLEKDGCKVRDFKLPYYQGTYEKLQEQWLNILQNWDLHDVEELLIYIQAKQQFIDQRNAKNK